MTSPGQPQPPDTITVGSRYTQDITEANVQAMAKGGFNSQFTNLGFDWRAFLAGIFAQITGAVNDIVDAFFGNYDGDIEPLNAFQDGQRALNSRLDAIEDVSGYCNVVMSYNTDLPYNWDNQAVTGGVPPHFDTQIGPAKHAAPYGGAGIKILAPGTWRIDTQVTVRGAFTVGGWARLKMEILVFDKHGVVPFSKKTYFNEVVGYHRTHTMSHTVVLPEEMFAIDHNGVITNGPLVLVALWQNRGGGTTIVGGDQYSFLSVNRWDLRTEALNPPPTDNIPDPITN